MDEFSLALLEDYGDRLDSKARDYLQYIRASSQDMSQLIDDILSLSKISRVKIQLDKIDLSGLAHKVVEELKRNQPDRKVEFIIDPDLEVIGDRNLLKQVLQNLLGNSYKFTGKQNQARIEFGRANEYDEDVYFVRDNGVGFDMTYDNKLFKPFQKLHRTDEFPGSGVGLASVQRIINRLGGRVWAEGNPGQGATFCFTLSKNEQA
jgi:light-regulated signal transduction histidine kinase (bacteriophytochrome)